MHFTRYELATALASFGTEHISVMSPVDLDELPTDFINHECGNNTLDGYGLNVKVRD